MIFDDPQVFDDPELFDDPQIFDDQLDVWTLIIEKSTVIPPSLMVLFFLEIVKRRNEICNCFNLSIAIRLDQITS